MEPINCSPTLSYSRYGSESLQHQEAASRMQSMDHYNLLYQEADAIFGLCPPSDGSGLHVRDDKLHALVIWSPHAAITATSPDLPASPAVTNLASINPDAFSLRKAPSELIHLGQSLNLPETAIAGGPTYIFTESVLANLSSDASPHQTCSVPEALLISSTSDYDTSQLLQPHVWDDDEWPALITNRLGLWAMAVLPSGRVICVCHTPAFNAQAAEAGIWTDPEYRGKRVAASVVAKWAAVHHKINTKIILYSTSSDNFASQSIAKQLQLQPLGYIWKLLR